MEIRGARALVTGASSGIGMATARVLAAAGARVALSGRRRNVLESLAEEIAATGASRPLVFAGDLAMSGAADELGRRAEAVLGGVDVLVNSAGAFATGSAADDSVAARDVFETNFWAPMRLTRALLPGMRARRQGAVVTLSSIATATPLPSMGSYPASKAALAAATAALRLELEGSGVRLILAFLGSVDTPMHASASRSYGDALKWMPLGRPDTAARRIVAAIRRGQEVLVYPRSVASIHWFPAVSAWVSARLMLPVLLGRRRSMGA